MQNVMASKCMLRFNWQDPKVVLWYTNIREPVVMETHVINAMKSEMSDNSGLRVFFQIFQRILDQNFSQ